MSGTQERDQLIFIATEAHEDVELDLEEGLPARAGGALQARAVPRRLLLALAAASSACLLAAAALGCSAARCSAWLPRAHRYSASVEHATFLPELHDELCHTAVKGEECYDAVHWGMTKGVFSHPEWYPGLSSSSTFDDFQLHLFAVRSKGCPMPCHGKRLTLPVPHSLLCFSVVPPFGYERGLLALQKQERASVFSCNEYSVYSNETIEIDEDLNTTAIKGLGDYALVPSGELYTTVWRQLISEGRFWHHDWTVKVEPDCVFFPSRLRMTVQTVREQPQGIFLANSELGLHQAFEAFSKNAVKALGNGMTRCTSLFQQQCQGDCHWHENLFLDKCLSEVLGVAQAKAFDLLEQDSVSCTNNTKVGFHPKKDFELYYQCLTDSRGLFDRLEFV